MPTTQTLHHGDQFDNIDWNYYRCIAPGESDLNILANHGFISRDGKNITIRCFTLDDLKLLVSLSFLHLFLIYATQAWHYYALGDNLHFKSTVFSTISETNPDSDVYNTIAVGKVLEERLALPKTENAELVNTIKER
ncbi:hypothetical protein EV368DRAFT_61560 [Lentinula lateritia]|nr:hypothetical protein EV368DRAFT_61560 [Lentinula lateritia]